VTVSHEALLVAPHAHPVAAVTVTVPVPAADVTFADAGEMVGLHDAPAWVTVNVLLPIVNVAVRPVVPGFAATL
jgi:hypothetical protein